MNDTKRLRVTSTRDETPQARTYVLEPLDGWQPIYKAGQFLTLLFKTRHGEKRRSYSISSSPDAGEPLTITVKRLDNGEFSRFLFQHAKPGDIFHTQGISGFFTLPAQLSQQAVCFIAAGSGITPCYAIIKTLLATSRVPVTLIYSNRSKADTIFYKALGEMEKKWPGQFRVKYLFSDSNNIYEKRLSKWLLEQLLVSFVNTPAPEVLFYTCGPFEYMQTIEITLRVFTDPDNIRKENFTAWPRLVLPEPPDKLPHTVNILVNGETYSIPVQYPQSILAAAKQRGINMPFSCEAGRCGACAATCTEGKVWMAYNEVLVDREVAKGRVLTCQGFPIFNDATIVVDAAG